MSITELLPVWKQLSAEGKAKFVLSLLRGLFRSAFRPNENHVDTPRDYWLRARFGLFGDGKLLSEEDGFILTALSGKYPEAWDVADHICTKSLLSGEPFPKALAGYVLERMEGNFKRPALSSGRGNKRDRNLYRNYFIVETLQKLEILGFNKLASREMIASVSQEFPPNIITVNTVHHIQRNRSKVEAEFQSFRDAEEEFHSSPQADGTLQG